MEPGDSTLIRELSSGKTVVTTTSGDSMEPLLFDRETQVTVIPAERELAPRELPLYRRPSGQFVMHRIIRVDKAHYYTRGDNRCGLEVVPREWVCGVVTAIYRKGREISVSDAGYRRYVALWSASYPLRWIWMHLRDVKTRFKN